MAGCAAVAGVLTLVPWGDDGAPPAPGPSGRATLAAGAGVPAALPDLTALISERSAHVTKHPKDDESWAVLGSAYVEQGRRTGNHAVYPQAEHALKTSLGVRPQGNVDALQGLTALANARHDYRAAKKWGEQALAASPARWTVHAQLIDTYTQLGDAKRVDASLEKLQKYGKGPAVLAGASQVYRDRGWREDATAGLSDAVALAGSPAEQAEYQHRMGELAWERGEAAEALRWFDDALRADPTHHASLAGRARALTGLDRGTEALTVYRSAYTKQPLPRYALELGELYESLGLGPAARAQYERLRTRLAQDAAAGVGDGWVLGLFEADHGEPDAAVKRLEAEWKRHPGHQVADALGWALHRAGDDKKADKFAEKAMKDGPHSALFAYHRAEIQRGLKDPGAARRYFQEALRINPHFSPLLAPAARQALEELGEPTEDGPAQMQPPTPEPATPPRPSSKPTPPRATAKPKPAPPRQSTEPTPPAQTNKPSPKPEPAR
ncbi:tetratricopeptide repeat protein [Streptomyces sp. YIM 130001]|nr:tetratricopeptide repeat protein [Streptomyces sp. YIM 130001]